VYELIIVSDILTRWSFCQLLAFLIVAGVLFVQNK